MTTPARPSIEAMNTASTPQADATISEIPTNRQRRAKDCTVIAHLSDLHLERDTDTNRERWLALRQSLEEHKGTVDLLVVTGDLIELPLWHFEDAFEQARSFLGDLCGLLEINAETHLLVVPGNHDVRRYRGFLSFSSQAFKTFEKIFQTQWASEPRFFPELGICFFSFNSNPRTRAFPDLAAGFVSPDELVRMRHHIDRLQQGDPEPWAATTRIALVHHHPMPIGPTQRKPAQLIGGEPYMLLKNAGLFMEEVLAAGMDLVLHGHRHYPAYSRASFARHGGSSHSITIVAAGSVGQDDDHPLSYQLLEIRDSGEVRLRRYCLRNATYQPEDDLPLVTYTEARKPYRDRLIAQQKPELHIGKYTCQMKIQEGSGDCVGTWAVKQATARIKTAAVSAIPRKFFSATGYFHAPSYTLPGDHQNVYFAKSSGVDAGLEPAALCGQIVFDPPVGESPVSYDERMQINNAFYFNLQDLLDSTGGRRDNENAFVDVPHVCEMLCLSVTFPERHFPKTFRVKAFKDLSISKPRHDSAESNLAQRFLTSTRAGRTVSLVLQKPLPGYSYQISWTLPGTEAEEGAFTGENVQGADEIRSRFLSGKYRSQVEQALVFLCEIIEGQVPPPDAAIFVYQKGSLVPVASVGSESFVRELHKSRPVQVGRTFVGQAYRRREPLVGVRLPTSQEADFYFDPTRDPKVLVIGKQAWLAIPLTYPIKPKLQDGLRVCVLWLGTSHRLSALVSLRDKPQHFKSLTDLAVAWLEQELLPAIQLKLDPVKRILVDSP